MSYDDSFLLLHVYFFVQKCLHVTKCCKYFILSSVILPLNIDGRAGVTLCAVCMILINTHIGKCCLDIIVILSNLVFLEGTEDRFHSCALIGPDDSASVFQTSD